MRLLPHKGTDSGDSSDSGESIYIVTRCRRLDYSLIKVLTVVRIVTVVILAMVVIIYSQRDSYYTTP